MRPPTAHPHSPCRVLPLLQVLLPPSGGRLILATEGVWGHGQDLLQLMHNAPLKTASFKVVKAISTSRSVVKTVVGSAEVAAG